MKKESYLRSEMKRLDDQREKIFRVLMETKWQDHFKKQLEDIHLGLTAKIELLEWILLKD